MDKVGQVMARGMSGRGGGAPPQPLGRGGGYSGWLVPSHALGLLILSTSPSSLQAQIHLALRHPCSGQLWESFCIHPGPSPVSWHLPWLCCWCKPEVQESYQPHSPRESGGFCRDALSPVPRGGQFWETILVSCGCYKKLPQTG